MAAAKPFLFDRDFDGRRRAEEMVPMSRHVADVTASERLSFESGRVSGREEAMAEQPARIAASLEKLALSIALEIARSEARAMAQELGAIDLALELARKIAGRAIEQYPAAAIESAVQECFAEARTAPHVAVRVHESLVADVKTHLAAMAADRGFAGKLIILGEPEIERGDVRLEWADGGVVRDRSAIEQSILRTIANHIAAVEAARQGDAQ